MDHSTSPRCPRCGASLDHGRVDGLCAQCLAALNFATETAPAGDAAAAMPAPGPAEIAPHFPQLEIIELLGRGGMGVVYKARQKALGRLVALKLLAPERVADPKFAERFAHEAKALAALSHPAIVTIHDFGQAGGFFYLLMEYVDGVNLRQAMKAGRFTPEQALAIVPPVCEALQYAHEHGIVHRDIKPENLLLDREGRVKIADFGIAKMMGAEAPAEPQPVGTPPYMAPEQKAHRATDHRADIYSLGVVLYEMLTGELPAQKLQPPSRRVQVDVRIDEIVLRALEQSPELRYQTAVEFRTRVEDVVSGAAPQPSTAPSGTLLKAERARITWDDAFDAAMMQPTMGEVALHADRLVVTCGGLRREIPLKDIHALREAIPPFWWSPAGHPFADVEFDEGKQRRRIAFLPGTAIFRTAGDAQQHVAEWLRALEAAVRSATGRTLPAEPGRPVLPLRASPASYLWLVLLVVSVLFGALYAIQIGGRLPLLAFLPLLVPAAAFGYAFWSSRSRALAPVGPRQVTPARKFGLIAAGLLLVGIPTTFLWVQLSVPAGLVHLTSAPGSVNGKIVTVELVTEVGRGDVELRAELQGPKMSREVGAEFEAGVIKPSPYGSNAPWHRLPGGKHISQLKFALPTPELAQEAFRSLRPIGPLPAKAIGRTYAGTFFEVGEPGGAKYRASFRVGSPLTAEDPKWLNVYNTQFSEQEETCMLAFQVSASRPGMVTVSQRNVLGFTPLQHLTRDGPYGTTIRLELTKGTANRVRLLWTIGSAISREEVPGDYRALVNELRASQALSIKAERGAPIELCQIQGKSITLLIDALSP